MTKLKRIIATVTAWPVAAVAMAQSAAGGAAVTQGIENITDTVGEWIGPIKSLIYIIAAIIAIVGAFTIFFKMQNGDQDVKKTIMLVIGGCLALVALASALPLMFGQTV